MSFSITKEPWHFVEKKVLPIYETIVTKLDRPMSAATQAKNAQKPAGCGATIVWNTMPTLN